MRSLSRAACAAANAPLGAGVLGWPTSRWITVSPAASFSAAAAITSMTMNGSTAPARCETGRRSPLLIGGRDMGGRSAAAGGEQRQSGARLVYAALAGRGTAADAVRTDDGVDIAAAPAIGVERGLHRHLALHGRTRDGAGGEGRARPAAAGTGEPHLAVAGI